MLAEVAAADSGFAPTVADTTPAPAAGPAGMVWIPGGEFSMGANIEAEDMCSLPGATKDAQPIHRVRVDPFWMDATEVTNEQFAKFVAATGYITVAEQKPTEAEFPGALSWEYLERGPEDFRVKITKLQATTGAKSIPAGCAPPAVVSAPVADSGVAEVDARGLEPPEPLIRILSALESASAGATVRARTDREPCHLFGEATQRGFRHESRAQPDGSWLTVLTRS